MNNLTQDTDNSLVRFELRMLLSEVRHEHAMLRKDMEILANTLLYRWLCMVASACTLFFIAMKVT